MLSLSAAILVSLSVFLAMVIVKRVWDAFKVRLEKPEAKPSIFGGAHAKAHFHNIARLLAPMVPEKMKTYLTRQLVQAGGLGGMTPAHIILYAIFSSLCSIALALLLTVSTDMSAAWLVPIFLAGALFPFIWLRDQIKKRHRQIMLEMPYHLDLLTLCVEAGLDFGAGVQKMVDKGHDGPLIDEFQAFLAELRVGKTRAEALQGMSTRVALEPLTNFTSALIQADRLGSGMGKTLRLQAEQLRQDRFQKAEKAAGEAPVKMLIPLVLFIFPTIWIVLGAPLIFEWMFKV
ncbi:MAG: type II secretion system F family protein [Myxococcota bacterium]|jgi:tight adherence protein C|nr:type II secretion system F family protein [Myxococcota bacterium]